ncbi:MAG: hypothetical protein Kow0029_03580 [Candidatus Rifleibacteriota bacterium]
MSLKFSSFDAMTRQNKITALMHLKETGSQKREDYYLALHAMLDNDIQVALAAKMLLPQFSELSFCKDFSKYPSVEIKEKIDDFLRQNVGFGPEIIELEQDPDRQKLAQNLQKKLRKFEHFQE